MSVQGGITQELENEKIKHKDMNYLMKSAALT